MKTCLECSRGNHHHCENFILPFCRCWRVWHGKNPLQPAKVGKTKETKTK